MHEEEYFWNPTGEQLKAESDPVAIAELGLCGYIKISKERYDELKKAMDEWLSDQNA